MEEDKHHPELADLDDGSSNGIPTSRGLRDFAHPADIATVFDRLGYRPPSSTAATPTPAIRSRFVCSQASSSADLDSIPWLTTGGGKTKYWASFLPHLLSAEDNRIFASGSYAHGTIVQAVSELLHDLTDGHHRRQPAAPTATHHCLPEHLSVLWNTSTIWSRDVDTGWADTLRYLKRCWNETSHWRSVSDARFLLLLQPAARWDCSPTAFDDRLCAALRGAHVEKLPPNREADLVVRFDTGVFVIQAKATTRSTKRRDDELGRKRATRMWLMCAGDKSDDDATVFELSGATEKDWLEEPIRATRLTSLSA